MFCTYQLVELVLKFRLIAFQYCHSSMVMQIKLLVLMCVAFI